MVNEFLNNELLNIVIKQFKLDIDGEHGINHWLKVYQNCLMLAEHYEVSSEVFELFSLLHDSKREDEYTDINHGKRAALFVNDLIKEEKIIISKLDKKRLIFACSNHTKINKNAKIYQDIIVQICIDADRLDIGRVGIEPDKKYFQTQFAKNCI